MMDLMSMISEAKNKSAKELLLPIKKMIEKALGKEIDSFSLTIDTSTNEIITRADNRFQKDKSKVVMTFMKMTLKKYLGKDTPNFRKVDLYYTLDETVDVVIYSESGIQTKKI